MSPTETLLVYLEQTNKQYIKEKKKKQWNKQTKENK